MKKQFSFMLVLGVFLLFASTVFAGPITNTACAAEGKRVNRNPFSGATNRTCCLGLTEIRVSKSYSICVACGDNTCNYPEDQNNCPQDCKENYSQITDQWCDALNSCPEGLECYQFPGLGLRCAELNPCNYYKCPTNSECIILESYPGQIHCQCTGPQCPNSNANTNTVSYNIITQTSIIISGETEKPDSYNVTMWQTGSSSRDKGIIEVNSIPVSYSKEMLVEESKLFMRTSVGKKQVNILPENAIKISESFSKNSVEEIELKEEAKRPVYLVTSTKKAKLFAIFPISLKIRTKIDAQFGKLISIRKPWWSSLTL